MGKRWSGAAARGDLGHPDTPRPVETAWASSRSVDDRAGRRGADPRAQRGNGDRGQHRGDRRAGAPVQCPRGLRRLHWLARRTAVNVIETRTNVGKAGALEEAIERFGLVQRFRAVLLLDAVTTIEPGYFDAALPHFDDPQVVAVAGAVRTHWHGRALSMV